MTTTDVKESTVEDITDVVWVLFVVAVDDDVAVVGAFVVFRVTVLNTLVFVLVKRSLFCNKYEHTVVFVFFIVLNMSSCCCYCCYC